MSINRAIENIFEGKLDEMRQNFSAAITSKAVEKLEERKIEIAENYFGQIDEEDNKDSKKLLKLDIKRRNKAKEANNSNSKEYRQRQLRNLDDRIMRDGRVSTSKKDKSYEE